MKRTIYLMLFAFLFAQTVATAETIKGMITSLDASRDMLSIRRTDASKNMPQQLSVRVKSDTKTKNVASLQELQVGHEVKIDAKEDKASGIFEAKSIEVTGSKPAQEKPAQSSTAGPEKTPTNY